MFWFLVVCFGFIWYAGNLPALIAGPDTPPAVLLSAPDPCYIGALNAGRIAGHIGALNAGQIGAIMAGQFIGAFRGKKKTPQIGAFSKLKQYRGNYNAQPQKSSLNSLITSANFSVSFNSIWFLSITPF